MPPLVPGGVSVYDPKAEKVRAELTERLLGRETWAADLHRESRGQAVRSVILANAGGAAASAGLIGAADATAAVTALAFPALLCFSLGVMIALCGALLLNEAAHARLRWSKAAVRYNAKGGIAAPEKEREAVRAAMARTEAFDRHTQNALVAGALFFVAGNIGALIGLATHAYG